MYSSGRRLALAALALAALVLAVAVAGCGSSSSKPKLTKAQFLTQANAICKTSNEKTAAAGAKLGSHPSQAQAIAVIKKDFIPDIQAAITGVRGLAVQTADKAKLTSMIDLAQADLDKVKANPILLFNNKTFADFAAQAHPYGLTECATNS